MEPTAFVEGWDFIQVLGEGAYGEVRLAVNKDTDEAVAVKIIDLQQAGSKNVENVRKETIIHRNLTHDNIIRYYGGRREGTFHYLFLEYASGGELFDRIEPDVGMPLANAQRYFIQLISAVEYLHQHGVSHRDLKPENLLLDDKDNLKVTDFGLATLFRHNGKTRKLDRCCGTVPYVAPEVMAKVPYDAEPADVWSCGIILVAMCAGELPWDEPTYACKEYSMWKDCSITRSPWSKIDNLVFSLLKKILTEFVPKRYTIAQIKKHPWFTKSLSRKALKSTNGSPLDGPVIKRLNSGRDLSPSTIKSGAISLSQPETVTTEIDGTPTQLIQHHIAFSQPLCMDNMLLSTQLITQGASQSPFQRLVKRMTRFRVRTDASQTTKEVKSICEKLGYAWKSSGPGQFTLSTFDRRKAALIIKLTLMGMDKEIMVDFRLSKGDGIEFKRRFIKIKEGLSSIISKTTVASPKEQVEIEDAGPKQHEMDR